jgi:hypothetical protein
VLVIDAPFQLDFAPDRILYFNHDWFVSPSPHVRNAEELRQGMVARNVGYIFGSTDLCLLQAYQSCDVNYKVLNPWNTLQALAKPFNTVYADSRTVLISLKPQSQMPLAPHENRGG